MLDQDFFDFLEFELCKAFKYSNIAAIKGFWCDGVTFLHDDNQHLHIDAEDNKEIKLKAYIGNDGQSVYELTLKLGEIASSRIAKNVDIKECVPVPDQPNWFNIDTTHRKIVIELN